MAQLAYNVDMGEAYVGMKADSGYDHVASFTAEGEVKNGRAVLRGANPEFQAKQVSSVTDVVLGVAIKTESSEFANYQDTETVNVLRSGAVWVNVNGQVTAGEKAYVTVTGDFTNVDNSNPSVGTFIKTTAGAGITVLELSIV